MIISPTVSAGFAAEIVRFQALTGLVAPLLATPHWYLESNLLPANQGEYYKMMSELAAWLSDTPLREFATNILSSVPGLPPVLQTVHLLSIVAIMASIVMIDLRILGLAVPSQDVREMITRLRPWTVWGIVGAASSGVWFILARPGRYLSNPVFQIKIGLLSAALILTFVFYRRSTAVINNWDGPENIVVTAKLYALVSLLLWLGVVMAGRWIAYSEYLFWPA